VAEDVSHLQAGIVVADVTVIAALAVLALIVRLSGR
jgi:hypothetical protein